MSCSGWSTGSADFLALLEALKAAVSVVATAVALIAATAVAEKSVGRYSGLREDSELHTTVHLP
tara:strand:- start:253 stop:444 length:192 start_codon:yes stop_codon:yes gene_type:complete